MYQAAPADAVRSAARHVRPGGVVAFAETNMPTGSAVPERAFADWPPTPASEQVNNSAGRIRGWPTTIGAFATKPRVA